MLKHNNIYKWCSNGSIFNMFVPEEDDLAVRCGDVDEYDILNCISQNDEVVITEEEYLIRKIQ